MDHRCHASHFENRNFVLMHNFPDHSCLAVPSAGEPPPPQRYDVFFPSTFTVASTVPPQRQRLETTSQLLNTINSRCSCSSSSNAEFVHGARYLQTSYPYNYYYARHHGREIWKQPQLCHPIINPASYATASAALMNKRLRSINDENKILDMMSSTNANIDVCPNSLRPNPSTFTRSQATNNVAESSLLVCKRKRDSDDMERIEILKESTDIDLELKL